MKSLQEFKTWFDEQFLLVLEDKSKRFLSYSNRVAVHTMLSHVIAIAKGGKRIRPYMAYIGYVTEGGEHDIFALYAAIELLHLFCLVHDDCMDNSDTRHDVKTMHKAFDNNTAILAGDMLLAWSFECLQSIEELEPYTVDDCMQEYITMLTEVIHGQLLDVQSMTNKEMTREVLETVIDLKSARYSFYRPMVMGMALAGADNEAIDFAQAYAINVGNAFQLQDDLRDWQEDEKQGQYTLVTWHKQTYPEASVSDTRHYVQEIIEAHVETARDAIYAYNKDSEEVFDDLIDTVITP